MLEIPKTKYPKPETNPPNRKIVELFCCFVRGLLVVFVIGCGGDEFSTTNNFSTKTANAVEGKICPDRLKLAVSATK
jgi:hypothetical protein